MTPKEFKNIAPKLYKLKRLESGFLIPKEYFKAVEDTVFSKIITMDWKKETPFEVPENYFGTVEEKIYNTIKLEEKEIDLSIPEGYFDTIEDSVFEKINRTAKVIPFKTRFIRTVVPIVAAASLLLFVTLQLLSKTETDLFANMEISEIESWIENGNLDLDSYEIAAVYQEVDFESLELNYLYDDENLIEYLEGIDIESLILTN